MNRNKELAKNTVIITLGKVCTQFISFFLLPLYTALLTTEQYGAVDLVSTYVQLLLPIVIFQIDQAVFRYLIDKRKDRESETELISSTLAFAFLQFILFTLLFSIILICFKIPYGWFLYINVVAASLSSIFLQIVRGIGDNGSYAIASFLAGFFAVLLNVVFIAGLNMKAEGMMLATFLSNMICTVYIFFKKHIYRYISLKKISVQQIRKMLGYSLPLIPNALSWWVVNASDRSIVLLFLGTSANGVLAASHKFSTMFTSIYNIFSLSWTESASLHLKEADGEAFFSNIVDTVYRLFVAVCIGIIACMPFVFPIMVNASYSEAYYQIPIYMIAGMFNVVAGLYGVVYIANRNTTAIAKTSIIAGVVNIIVNLALIQYIGLYAASISSAVAYGAMAVYRCFDIKKYLKPKINKPILLSSIVVFTVITSIYYSQNLYLEVIGLIVTVLYALVINFRFIISILRTIKGIIKRRHNDC